MLLFVVTDKEALAQSGQFSAGAYSAWFTIHNFYLRIIDNYLPESGSKMICSQLTRRKTTNKWIPLAQDKLKVT